jgi:peptide/nickel transport system permease protein
MQVTRRVAFQVLRLVFVLWLVSILVFLALRLTPGDPALLVLGSQASGPSAAVTLAHLRMEMGLDKPWPVQYGIWLGGILSGNLGVSNLNQVPVLQLVAGAAPSTLWLILLAVIVSVPLALLLGLWAAGRRSGIVNRLVRTLTTLSIAVPAVWLGLLLIILFSVTLRILPSGGYVSPLDDPGGFVVHMILPVATLAVFLTGILTRYVYSEASDVLRQDFMRTSTAMGLPRRKRIFVYAAKNAALPLITVVGTQVSSLVGGAVLVEAVFNLGGIGQLLLSSVLGRDYQVVQGAVLLTTVVVVLVGFLANLAYRFVDPRISR